MKKEIDETYVQEKKENDLLLEAESVEATAVEAVEDSKSKPIVREGKVIRQVIDWFF